MVDEPIEGDDPQGDPSAPEDPEKGKTVPIGRFKEQYKKTKDLEQEVDSLKQKTEPQLTPEQQKEKQAKDYLRGLIKDERKKVLAEEAEVKVKEQKDFESDVSDILAVNTDVDKEEFLKFIENSSDDYGITSVKGAMKLYKDLGKVKTDTQEETKEKLAKKPNLPKGEGLKEETPPDDSTKSYEQIVEESVRESEKGQK